MSAIKRIQKELNEISEAGRADTQNLVYSVSPIKDNLFEWEGFIFGPSGSPYQNGAFKIKIDYPSNYPFKPPKVMFKTKIYHPNVGPSGAICLDILKDKWSPALTIVKVLMSISSLLTEPNPDDPLEPTSASMLKSNPKAFEQIAREWTQLYAQM
jgi:ubiquitin-conjugating enzyme E2 D/E